MTKLVGLKMQGIRSIGDEPHCINFLNPLTIIQGENGTGKTTIIEALNYVTSGTLPAGKMSSFIHNNKLSKKKRVDAMVQLHFLDYRGSDCTATKRMLAQMSAGEKVTTKSDEFTLHIKPLSGPPRSLSAKIADFNKEIEQLFGVPSAILQHVIFCHQEESTWPLGEPKELKTKFDAIFEVEKFVKVVDSLKKCRKDFGQELKTVLAELPLMEKNVTQLASQYIQREEVKKKLENIRTFLTTKIEERSGLKTSLEGLQGELGVAANLEKEIGTHTNEIKVQEARMRTVDQFDGTKEQLKHELNAFKTSSEFANSETEKQRADADRRKLMAEISTLMQQQEKARSEISRMEGKQMVLEKTQKDYTTLLNEAAEKFQIEAKPSELVNALKQQIASSQTELEVLKKSHAEDRGVYTKKVDELREKIAKLSSVDAQKRREVAQLRGSIQKLEDQLKNMDESTSRMSKLQDEVASRTDEIRQNQSDRDKSLTTLKKKLNTLNVYPQVMGEISDVEMLTTRLDGLIIQNNGTFSGFVNLTLGDKSTQLDNAKKDLVDRKKQMAEAEVEMQNAIKTIPALRAQQKEAEEKLRKADAMAQAVQGNLIETIQTMRGTISSFEKAEKNVSELTAEMQNHNVDEARQRLTDSGRQIETNRAEIQRLALVIADCDNRQQQLRYFEDNLANFEAREKIAELNAKITEIRTRVLRPAAEINLEVRKLSNQMVNIQSEIQKNIGARDQLESNERTLQTQLSGESIQDVTRQLKQKVNQKIAIEATISDLQKFAKVVDDSIIGYHSQKMEQINEILREFWPRVYQGNDIEFIQIRAGQKMLASILIRIALSEVFGANCSILALDEPTTNLDSVKVENMGSMLRDLLDACKNPDGTYSLQLIVITHDKRLVEHLYTSCRPECVYGLIKDETGTSRIKTYHSVIDEPDDVRMEM